MLRSLFWPHKTGPKQQSRLVTDELGAHRLEILDFAAQYCTAAVSEQFDDRPLDSRYEERGLRRGEAHLFYRAAHFSVCVEKESTVEDLAFSTERRRP